jgi:hypothetical protein
MKGLKEKSARGLLVFFEQKLLLWICAANHIFSKVESKNKLTLKGFKLLSSNSSTGSAQQIPYSLNEGLKRIKR